VPLAPLAGSKARALAVWLLAIAGSALALVLAAWLAPLAPIDPRGSEGAALVAYAIGYACTAAVVLVVAALGPRDGRVALVASSLAVTILALLFVEAASPSLLATVLVLAALLAIGTSVGATIGGRIQHAGHLSVVVVVSSIADLASVLAPSGPSHEIAESPALLSLLALSWPMAGTTRIEPLLGVGDVVFVALYLGAAAQHGLSMRRTLVALASALAITAAVVALLALPIPALPFLGAAMLIAHPAARLPPAEERAKAGIALVLFVLSFGTLVLVRWSG
jgi:hypothetical protein